MDKLVWDQCCDSLCTLTYRFMWQLCSSIPSTLPDPKAISLMTAKVRPHSTKALFSTIELNLKISVFFLIFFLWFYLNTFWMYFPLSHFLLLGYSSARHLSWRRSFTPRKRWDFLTVSGWLPLVASLNCSLVIFQRFVDFFWPSVLQRGRWSVTSSKGLSKFRLCVFSPPCCSGSSSWPNNSTTARRPAR